MGKFFTTTVKPTITASEQHDGAFAAGDVLFDWTAFDVPKGSSLLRAAVGLIRGTNGADQAAVDMELFFAKSINGTAPSTLGDLNDPVDTATATGTNKTGWFNNLIGLLYFDVSSSNIGSSDDLVYMNMVQMGNRGGSPNIVLTGEPDSGTNVGYDKIYVAGILKTALDLESLTRINNGTLDGSVLTVNGTDPRLFLAVGDTIAATTATDTSASTAIGEVSALAELAITLTAATEVAVVNDDFIYNVNPIRFIFSFEK